MPEVDTIAHVDLLEREPLLTSLRELRAGSVDTDGCLVLVSGEAGIGKAELVRCFREALPPDIAARQGSGGRRDEVTS